MSNGATELVPVGEDEAKPWWQRPGVWLGSAGVTFAGWYAVWLYNRSQQARESAAKNEVDKLEASARLRGVDLAIEQEETKQAGIRLKETVAEDLAENLAAEADADTARADANRRLYQTELARRVISHNKTCNGQIPKETIAMNARCVNMYCNNGADINKDIKDMRDGKRNTAKRYPQWTDKFTVGPGNKKTSCEDLRRGVFPCGGVSLVQEPVFNIYDPRPGQGRRQCGVGRSYWARAAEDPDRWIMSGYTNPVDKDTGLI